LDSGKIFELADQLKTLREEKEKVEERVKRLNAAISEVEYALSEAMALSETQNFTRAGTLFYLTTKIHASAIAGFKEELYAALKENGFAELVQETVNVNSLSSFVKEQMEENNDALPIWLTGLVTVFHKTTVGVRKATKN
jgi:hypothetical protein